MKNRKLFIVILLCYLILHNIIFETIRFLFYSDSSDVILFPLVRVYKKIILGKDIDIYNINEIIIFSYISFMCLILYFISYNWLIHYNTLKTYFKLIITYILISLLTWFIITLNGIGLGTIGVFIIYFLIPMLILVLVTVPFFWLLKSFYKFN